MAVENFFGAETAWFAEYEAAPSKVLAHHWPDVPNYGDMTAIDWASVPKVDIVTGGTPCQDLSAAGRRRGMTEGTRSNLWVQMRECIAAVRPSVVIWENVRGAYSAHATSEVEHEQGLLGEPYGPGRPALRALHRVLGDLADLGFDAEWVGVRAADAGAPHGRFRVFVVAYAAGARRSEGEDPGTGSGDAGARAWGLEPERGRGERTGPAEDANLAARGEWRLAAPGQTESGRSRADARGRGRAPAADTRGDEPERRGVGRVLGGETAAGEGDREERKRLRDSAGDRSAVAAYADDAGRGEYGRSVAIRAQLATAEHARNPVQWGAYEPAIRRGERAIGRVAPAPTNPDGKGGAHRLAPEFVEWMMGLPAGHVTNPIIGITRNEQLKALGNGVVPQQAELALSHAWERLADVRTEVAA